MFVNSDTFEKAFAEALLFDHGGVTAHTAAIQHLIAMKLHALRSGQAHREAKDFGDLLNLVIVGHFDVRAEEFRQLCLKYGTIELYERILKTKPRKVTGHKVKSPQACLVELLNHPIDLPDLSNSL